MVNLTADPGVVIIDVLTGRDEASVRIIDLYLPAVRDAEQFIVIAGDKADTVIMRILPVRLSIGSPGVLNLIQSAKSNSGNHFTLEADLLNSHHSGTGKRISNRILQHILIGDQAGVLSSAGRLIKGFIGKSRLHFLQMQIGLVVYQIQCFLLIGDHFAPPPLVPLRLFSNSR